MNKLIAIWTGLLFAGICALSLSAMPSVPTTSMPVPKEMSVGEIKRQARFIPFADLARNPDFYRGALVTHAGKVEQVMEDGQDLVLRINVATEKYTHDIVWVQYRNPRSSRILEGDRVTFWGKYAGIQSYKAVLGHTIQIPAVLAQVLE